MAPQLKEKSRDDEDETVERVEQWVTSMPRASVDSQEEKGKEEIPRYRIDLDLPPRERYVCFSPFAYFPGL